MPYLKDKILVIAPHHDDEILGCGGFIKKSVDSGNSVAILFITSGWSGIKEKKMSTQEKINIREGEAKKANGILGVKKLIFLRKEDRAIYADKKLLIDIVRIIQKVQPQIMLCPHKDDADFEHKIINRLTKEAIWLARDGNLVNNLSAAKGLNKILFYEVWTPILKPNFYVNITDQIETKNLALMQYKSQLRQRSYSDMAVGLNMFRGGLKGYKYAEAFVEQKI